MDVVIRFSLNDVALAETLGAAREPSSSTTTLLPPTNSRLVGAQRRDSLPVPLQPRSRRKAGHQGVVRQLTIGAAVAVTGRVLTSYASLVTATVTDMLLPGAPW